MSCKVKLYGWEHMAVSYPRELLGLQTIATTHGLAGYQHLRLYSLIPLISNDTVTLRIDVDGTVFSYTIASTGGAFRKTLVPMQVMKGKTFSYRLSSPTVFRFWQDQTEFAVKPWGDAGPYRIVNPFGAGSVVA